MSLRHPIAIIILMVMAMSLVSSKAGLSITMGALAIIAMLDIQVNPFKVKFILTWEKLKTSIKEKPFIWVFASFWLLYFISIIYAGDFGAWWYLTHPKFAFLLLPLSFALLQPLSRKEYMFITLCMIIMAVWASIWVQAAYFSNYELFNKSLGFGASLPTPGSHIRYSTIIAISMILCLGFAIENWKIKYHWERLAYIITGVYLFYFLHIL